MLQSNAKLLPDPQPFTTRTKYGQARIRASSVSGHRVVITREPQVFRSVTNERSRDIVIPDGVGLMYNGEQKIYQIFERGMYDMLRSRTHASKGERRDVQDVHEMRQMTFDFVGRLRTWSLLGDEARAFTDDTLLLLANQLDHPKRNERKLTASRRFRKAAALRTAKDKRMPMPAAFTASAGAHHLDLRRADVREILKYVDPERLKIFALVQGAHARIDDAWRVFRPAAFLEPGNAIMLACEKPDGRVKRVVRDQLRPIYAGLQEIRVRPLNGLATRVCQAINAIVKKIEAFVRRDGEPALDVAPELDRIRENLALMLMIREIEMEAIMPISFLLARWRRLDDGRRDEVMRVARARCEHLWSYFQMNVDHFGSAGPAGIITAGFQQALRLTADPAIENKKKLLAVKRALKWLSASLAA